MKKIIASIITKILNVDTISSLMAKIIANILNNASKKGGEHWDITKNAISKINKWTNLFLEVYEDDNLTTEEEKKIADAINNETNLDKIIYLIKA